MAAGESREDPGQGHTYSEGDGISYSVFEDLPALAAWGDKVYTLPFGPLTPTPPALAAWTGALFTSPQLQGLRPSHALTDRAHAHPPPAPGIFSIARPICSIASGPTFGGGTALLIGWSDWK